MRPKGLQAVVLCGCKSYSEGFVIGKEVGVEGVNSIVLVVRGKRAQGIYFAVQTCYYVVVEVSFLLVVVIE